MEHLARWTLAQAFGLLGTLAVIFRDNYRAPLPALDLSEFLLRFGPQASAFGLVLALWPVLDLLFRACAPDRAWQCAGAFNRWAVGLLLFFLCVHVGMLGLVVMSEPAALAGAVRPALRGAYGMALLATGLLSLAYVLRLEFVLWNAHDRTMRNGRRT